jgi:transposase
MLSQLAWRWLGHQPESALAQWFNARLGGAKGRMKKVLIVALMRMGSAANHGAVG